MQSDMTTPLLASSSSDLPDSAPSPPQSGPVVGIIGSGDFWRSLSLRLLSCGFRVVVGSRDPARVGGALFHEGVELRTQAEAVEAAERVVFAAVYPEHYHTLQGLRAGLTGKVLVDVSNAESLRRGRGRSNAEILAEMFPKSAVVKGFNTVSAWALQDGAHDGSRQVPVCSDCPSSKAEVVLLARHLGFSPVDVGGLCASRDVEDKPLLLFPSWGGPTLTTCLLFLFFYGYNFMRHVLLPYLDKGENNFHLLPLVTVNQTLPSVALVTLALVYLPGLLAALLQLVRGTKYRRFPAWLARWLCSRKQLGLMSFLCAALHAVYSVCLTLRRAAGSTQVGLKPQVWRSDLYLSSGILGLGVLSVLAITSLPSVGNTLTWREFTFVQSGLGYVALTLSVAHTLFFGWDFAFSPSAYQYFLPPVFLLTLVLPCIVLVGRLLLALPCLAFRLTKIRRGWESCRHRSWTDTSGPRPAEGGRPQSFGDV